MDYKEILRYPEKIPCDKRMHFMIGVIFIAISVVFTLNPLILLPALVAVSWGIEIFQKVTKSGAYDNLDAVAVMLGGLSVYIGHVI